MTLQPGARLGPYEVVSHLGSGGMGEVYRARDAKLHRDVAIKILPSVFARDPDRLARFEREAQVLASLNHGGIAHVYGILELPPEGGSHGLVMELVDGHTLDTMIPPGGMPLATSLALAIQMADALAAAHAAGVVHRDFKPGNVAVTAAGQAKVLDFGLAKTALREVSSGATQTMASPRTEAGLVMGTVAYMSPEQAAGRHVDARSDIFSFGSVLFEMVTGTRAFDGDTSMSTLAAIINEPARTLTQVNAAVPRELERLIARCHRKDPVRRVQSMADLRSTLEELRDDLESGRLSGSSAIPIARPRSRAPRYAAMTAAGLALAAGGAMAGRIWLAPDAPQSAWYRLDRMTADPGVTIDPAVTSRGDLLAYASDRHSAANLDIWVQPTAGGEPVRVTTDPADDRDPSFSPDGSRIAFRSEREGGGIYIVPALGGTERLLVPLGRSPQFSPDGKWLQFATGGRGSRSELYLMPAAGGEAQRIGSEFAAGSSPVWAPDSKSILFRTLTLREGGSATAFAIVRVDDRGVVSEAPSSIDLENDIRNAGLTFRDTVSWNGREMIFSASAGDGGGLWSISTGAAPRVPRPIFSTTELMGGAVAAASGRIFFGASTRRASIAALTIEGARVLSEAPEPLTASVAMDRWPSLSADGKTLAFQSTRYGGSVWVRDLSSGREAQLPVGTGMNSPVISPDGRRVVYSGPKNSIFMMDTRGGVARTLCEGCGRYTVSWSPDGAYVFANTISGTPETNPIAIQGATGKVTPVTTKGPSWFPRMSPDGRWVSFYEWPQPDRTREIVARYTPGDAIDDRTWIPVTDGQSVDESAAWSPDGRTLYFTSERDGFRCLYASRFDPGAGKMSGPPEPLFHLHGTRRTLIDTAAQPGRIDAAAGRLVFSMQEVVSNIWSLTPR